PNESTCALFAPPSKVYSHFFTYRCLPGLKHAAPRRLPRLGAGQGIPEAATLVQPLVLESIQSPADIRGLSRTELEELAGEIRTFLVEKVTQTSGHLSPNLGVVELTLAVHRVFESPA